MRCGVGLGRQAVQINELLHRVRQGRAPCSAWVTPSAGAVVKARGAYPRFHLFDVDNFDL
jgi:hypothetical protein